MDIESDFCRECPEYGEPNGCNRSTGSCDAYNSCLELKAENAKLRKVVDAARNLPCPIWEHSNPVEDKLWDFFITAVLELDKEGER